jgi:hypothetical protein
MKEQSAMSLIGPSRHSDAMRQLRCIRCEADKKLTRPSADLLTTRAPLVKRCKMESQGFQILRRKNPKRSYDSFTRSLFDERWAG